MTTTLITSADLSRDTHANSWATYITDGDYTPDQAERLIDALIDATRDELNNLLPDGCYWSPDLSEITGPADTDLDDLYDEDGLDHLLQEASDAVIARFNEIEADALGPTTVTAKHVTTLLDRVQRVLNFPPLEQTRHTADLGQALVEALSLHRRACIAEEAARRGRGGQKQIAEELGISQGQVAALIREWRDSLRDPAHVEQEPEGD